MQNEEILKSAGFNRNPRREHWFSRDHRKLFSFEVLQDHDSEWLKRKLMEDVSEQEFRFYRNTSDLPTCVEVLEEMGLGNLTPVESLT